MERTDWSDCEILFPLLGDAKNQIRLTLRSHRRLSQTPLFFQEPPPQAWAFPAALFSLDRQEQQSLGLDELAQRAEQRFGVKVACVSLRVCLTGQAERLGGWVQGLSLGQADVLCTELGLEGGWYLTESEEAHRLGSGEDVLFVHALPRIVLDPEERIADNTDPEKSMDRLLERFLMQFTDLADQAMPYVAIATGYLYKKGLVYLLRLLENQHIRKLRLLFSGRADRATADLLEQVFLSELDQRGQSSDADLLYQAVEEERLAIRVYPHAFLHAKLYLGWRLIDRQGFPQGAMILGSSNVTGPGLLHHGNLELNAYVDDRHTLRSVMGWFEARWEEAEEPNALLLQALESRREIAPPPAFEIEGLREVWEAGRLRKLEPAARYLDFLARLYRQRIDVTRVDINEPAFPPDDLRRMLPAPEQESGVLALAQRLLQLRFAFLADSVGLGKTVTSLGVAWYLYRLQEIQKAVVIAPRKLFGQWESDRKGIRMPEGIVSYENRHILERKDEAEALRVLAPFDLLIVEEAHEILRSRKNKLWSYLRAHLQKYPKARLLLVSATPWNNTREDIFNYILLAWHDGRLLWESYPLLGLPPTRKHVEYFVGKPATAAKTFLELARNEYRTIFGETFVQRTRHRIARLYQRQIDFPTRNVIPYSLPSSTQHDAFFGALERALEQAFLSYREPFRALQRAVVAVHPHPPQELTEIPISNLHRSFVIQLYKRAESSFFALAVSLRNVRSRLITFEKELVEIAYTSKTPRDDLKAWMEKQYLRLNLLAIEVEDIEEVDEDLMTPAEKARYGNLHALFAQLDDDSVKAAVKHLIECEVAPDQALFSALQKQITLPIEIHSPKGLYVADLLHLHHQKQRKFVLVAGYTDTAVINFLRAIETIPKARIGLAIGGNEAWIYDPQTHRPKPLSENEWESALSLPTKERYAKLLVQAGRAKTIERSRLLQAFAPKAQRLPAAELASLGGEVDVLVGSEAISVGQNLQDATSLFQLDMPWNPMVIEQRIGRIDRRGGGRLKDPDDPHSPKIVDIFYCWSQSAIENEITLRDKLKTKAEAAIQDTHFDELLLYELRDLIEEIRQKTGDFPEDGEYKEQLAAFFKQRQEELLEKQTLPEEISEQAGAWMEGVRHLAVWTETQRLDLTIPPQPVVACGYAEASSSGSWKITLELQPYDERGQRLGLPIFESLSIPADIQLPLEQDLEAVVLSLLDGQQRQAHRTAPPLSAKAWRLSLEALQQRLRAFQQSYLDQHNEQIRQKAVALNQQKRTSPTAAFRLLCGKALTAVQNEIKNNPFYKTSEGREHIQSIGEKLKFFLTLLTPPENHRVLQDADEREIESALQFVSLQPRRFLREDFETFFLAVAGPAWSEDLDQKKGLTPSNAQLELVQVSSDFDSTRSIERAAEGRWTTLSIKVVAAAFLA
ncbi:phospholipase D-like domain-containing protein [Myxococcota bacterium]|nr:phospholipase D-like domain-containing protein [Myxococcota bacterium]